MNTDKLVTLEYLLEICLHLQNRFYCPRSHLKDRRFRTISKLPLLLGLAAVLIMFKQLYHVNSKELQWFLAGAIAGSVVPRLSMDQKVNALAHSNPLRVVPGASVSWMFFFPFSK